MLNNQRRLIIQFQKNFKFKIQIQIKKILNFIPSPNKIPKIYGGKKIKKRIEKILNKAKELRSKKSFLFFLLSCFKVFHSQEIIL